MCSTAVNIHTCIIHSHPEMRLSFPVLKWCWNIRGNQINCGRWIKGGSQGGSQGHSAQQIILFVNPVLTLPSPESGCLSLTHMGPHTGFSGVRSQRELRQLLARHQASVTCFEFGSLVKWDLCLETPYAATDLVYITLTSKGIKKCKSQIWNEPRPLVLWRFEKIWLEASEKNWKAGTLRPRSFLAVDSLFLRSYVKDRKIVHLYT